MPTHGTQCRGIRDDQDEILAPQQGVCRGERQPPTPVSCKRKSKFGDGDADRATGTWKGASPAGLAGLREGFPDGDSREAAVTVAKSKGVIKDTEPQSCIHRAPASPRSGEGTWQVARSPLYPQRLRGSCCRRGTRQTPAERNGTESSEQTRVQATRGDCKTIYSKGRHAVERIKGSVWGGIADTHFRVLPRPAASPPLCRDSCPHPNATVHFLLFPGGEGRGEERATFSFCKGRRNTK